MITTTETPQVLTLHLAGAVNIASVSGDAVTLRQALSSEKQLALDFSELESLDQAGLQLILASLKTGRFNFKPAPVLTKALLGAGLNKYAPETGGKK